MKASEPEEKTAMADVRKVRAEDRDREDRCREDETRQDSR